MLAPEKSLPWWVAATIPKASLTVLLMLSVPMFVASRLIAPVLAQLVEGWPRFMGVPVPVVLGVLVAALALRPRPYLLPLRLGAIFPVR